MFDRISPRYDLLNRILSLGLDRRWRRCLAARVERAAPGRVLDLCAGTGDVALGLPVEPQLTACDFSLAMLALASQKARAAGRALGLVAGDALAQPLRSESVDLVTIAFGVRNFESLDRGLAEITRVLRPAGRLLILEFSRPRGPLAPFLGWWMGVVPPIVGRLVSGDSEAYSYLPASMAGFPQGRELCAVLAAHGLSSVSAQPLSGGVVTLYEGIKGDGGTNGAKEQR
jgi:demethylmenaquinone methyltransferase/2-methoxy-6-polyprenyl-1,4-benzoquinol methylase